MIEEKKQKKNKVVKGIALLGLFLMVVGISYALFRVTLNGNKVNKIKTGKMELLLTERNANVNEPEGIAINIENAIPMSDDEGKTLEDKYEFDILNKGDVNAKYEMYVDVESDSTLDPNFVKAYLELDGEAVSEPITLGSNPDSKGGYKIETGVVAKGYRNQYTLRLFLKEETELEDVKIDEDTYKEFNAKIRVEGTQLTSVENPYRPGSAAYKIVQDNTVIDKKGSFSALGFNAAEEASGLYRYTDKSGTSTYAYRGMALNNNIEFAGLNWQIVRILEDGSMRLILDQNIDKGYTYDGNKIYNPYDTVIQSKTYTYSGNNEDENLRMNDVKYENSKIKGTIGLWYDDKLSAYDNKIAKSTYCNDMSNSINNDYSNYLLQSDFNKTFGFIGRINTNNFDFTLAKYCNDAECSDPNFDLFYKELNSLSITPTLSCREEDKVQAKAALLTADEYVVAGGKLQLYANFQIESDSVIYLTRFAYNWWTMTPIGVYTDADNPPIQAQMASINDDGYIEGWEVNNNGVVVRPVITLKSTAKISRGNGELSTPYIVE